MKFLSEDFLLTNESAKMLFHKHAEKIPIIIAILNPQKFMKIKNMKI